MSPCGNCGSKEMIAPPSPIEGTVTQTVGEVYHFNDGAGRIDGRLGELGQCPSRSFSKGDGRLAKRIIWGKGEDGRQEKRDARVAQRDHCDK
jgi:hypothetical protein